MRKRQVIFAIVILLIGVVIGMLTSAHLRLNRMKPMRMYFSEERFREGFYRLIQPDEEQKAKIDLILDKYARINSETQSRFRKELDSNVKAMRKELDSNLTKEQLDRIKEMDERRQEMMKESRKRRESERPDYRDDRPYQGRRQGPPPPPPPPRDSADYSIENNR